MPPPLGRPTVASALKASVTDEKKRLENVAAENANVAKYRKKTTLFGTQVTPVGDSRSQKEKKNGQDDDWGFRGINRQNSGTGRTGSGSIDQRPKLQNGDKKSNKDVTDKPRDGSGKISQAVGTDKGTIKDLIKEIWRHPYIVDKQVVNTQNWYVDMEPRGYAKISASKAKMYHDNLDFYRNKIHSKPPPGHTIEEMLKWKGNYGMLERNHRYIQWLFPIPEGSGLNIYAQQLFEHEAQSIMGDDVAHKRVLKAFKMMLDFYGMQLASSVHGTVKRSTKGWEERYSHLNRSRHNFLRITRILKSLGELGYERLQAPWVHFLIDEAVINRELPNLNGACLMHWISAVKDDGEKEILFKKANGLPINLESTTYNTDSESEDEEEHVQDGDVEKAKDVLSSLELGNDEIESKEKKKSVTQNEEEVSALPKKNDVNGISEDAGKSDAACADEDKLVMVKSQQRKQLQTAQLPCDNLKFYQNNLNSRPSPGYTIETMLRYKGQYEFFEDYPYFIHWLFPIPGESPRNPEAQPLLPHEAEAIRNDDVIRSRFLQAYTMMLDFFGMRLIDEVNGNVEHIPETCIQRYKHLDTYRHNYLRITRILISLGELGFERFQVPLIKFFIKEGIKNKMIKTLKGSCVMHWINSIKDGGEKQAMFEKYQKLAGYNADVDSEDSEDEVDFNTCYNDVYDPYRNADARPSDEAIDNFMAGKNMNF